jgi:hypothetical protein
MVEQPPEPQPIPPDLAQAFHDALAQLRGWQGGPEPEVSYQLRPRTISAVFDDVINFNDPVPDNVQAVLLQMRIDLPPELPGFTYAAAGRGCHKELDARKARFERGSEGL